MAPSSPFPPTPDDAWLSQLAKELRGADFDEKLVWQHPDGYRVRPFYRRDPEGSAPAAVPGLETPRAWALRPRYDGPPTAVALREAHAASASREAQGLDWWTDAATAETLADALPEGTAVWLTDARRPAGDGPWMLDAGLRQAPRGRTATEDEWRALLDHDGPVYLDGAAWTDAGADAPTELAALLAAGTEWLARVADAGGDPVAAAGRLTVRLAAGPLFFSELAKFRAWRLLWALAGEGWSGGGADAPAWPRATVHGTCSTWNLPRADRHGNLIRLAAQAMSAAMGGADALEIPRHDVAFGADSPDPAAFSRRVSENIALLLRHESRLERSADPAAGSWTVEHLTDEIGRLAWDRFRAIQGAGGYAAWLASGAAAEAVDAARAARRAAFAEGRSAWIGVNRYPNGMETAPEPAPAPAAPAGADFPPLLPWAAEAEVRAALNAQNAPS